MLKKDIGLAEDVIVNHWSVLPLTERLTADSIAVQGLTYTFCEHT